MVPEKYAALGFEITKFGKNSSALRFEHRPVFVFNANSHPDTRFLANICEIYLKLSAGHKNLSCIKGI